MDNASGKARPNGFVMAGLVAIYAMSSSLSAQSIEDIDEPRPIEGSYTLFTDEMTWMEVRDAIREGMTTLIIATGGVEKNGPFLAGSKHNIVAQATAPAIARRLGNALVAPIVKFVPEGNINPPTSHMQFHGTISLREETFQALLTDIVSSMAQHGFTDVVLLGDSGGSQGGMQAVSDALNAQWRGTPARVYFIAEYYEEDQYSCEYLKSELGIFQQPDECSATRNKYHEDYHYTSIMATIDPEHVRAEQRMEVGLFEVNGVDLNPLEQMIANGYKLVEHRADITARAIREAMERRRAQEEE